MSFQGLAQDIVLVAVLNVDHHFFDEYEENDEDDEENDDDM